VAGRPAALVSDESALEACIRDDALYKLTIFTFFLPLLGSLPCLLHVAISRFSSSSSGS